MKSHSGFGLAFALIAIAAGFVEPRAHAYPHEPPASNSTAHNSALNNNEPSLPGADSTSPETGSQPRTAVVLRFAVESQPVTDTSALSSQACPQTSTFDASLASTRPSNGVTVDPKILDKISGEMQTKLSRKMSVMVNPDPAAIPVGAVVISGCITKATSGNAYTRLIGMNVGASQLSVHVVAFSRTKDGWNPMDTFDVQVKGGDVLPPIGPIGLALHAARDTQQTLPADAKKLADHILKRLSRDMKPPKDSGSPSTGSPRHSLQGSETDGVLG